MNRRAVNILEPVKIPLKVLAHIIPVIAIMTSLVMSAIPVSAAGPTVGISPENQSIANGSNFSVDITVNTNIALRGWQTNVDFDPTKVQIVSITRGSFLENYAINHGGTVGSFYTPFFDNTGGHVTDINYTITGGEGGPTGAGILCTLTFMAKQDVNAITSITLSYVEMFDIEAIFIPGVTTAPGRITIGNATRIITASAGQNGVISPSGEISVNYSADKTFAITPNAGYHIADVLVDGYSIGAVTEYTFTAVTADHTISASFAINTFTIVASAGANGSITPSGDVTVEYGSSQTFTVTPENGYRVESVTVDGVAQGTITSYTFNNVIDSHTISVSFIPVWDLNGDRTCNIGDVVVIGLHWSEIGLPGWIPSDLNKDGCINIGDVVVVGLHWDEAY